MKTATVAKQREVRRDDVNFVWIGFNDACINWQVQFRCHDFDIFKKAIVVAGQYNNFDPALIVDAVSKIESLVHEFRFGREGSPVLYITLNDSKDVDTVLAAFANTSVDERAIYRTTIVENSFDPEVLGTETTIRLWWD